jgi:hypothetical protein
VWRFSASRVEIARFRIADHAVEELLLVCDVLVERHRHDAKLLCEPAHAERFKPGLIGERDGSLQHASFAQRCPAGV